ncbi:MULTISPECIES: glucose 1-dehydrogenase [Rhodococcus]|uniref:Glucose 1-dehydrogenase n=1 Tax=Rhodococcus oxybenzonivorans TaxID=1990687 RepID=A0AAE4V1D6_9NOCA|nr:MULTISPECIES: glucose 1-dehydrogenase [Rhodococcus]MDV7245255.1 glucose 1-dehydrogenase [Rhodococcus oxybenzonivorans]MDV7267030.1 glucose 1-dehydrogenase [Rhodococcus oxybenzonivorans]MDV7272465.1 glucose 1-dehydrogenase [Rhodococcus oxybenzonivorans]MDV7336280.1 glucose 1-dehydrogenase [Rhodococcus oxybenzonivorans]MDV7342965.1 glucose 1-dehydrogenase [Rhodococcus oxybenzonivorans]
MDFQLQGKVAIVTGASRGLGKAAAEALLDEGAFVVLVARTREPLEELHSRYPERTAVQTCDMRDMDAVAALADIAVEAFGRLDIVVNNAGIAPAGRFDEQPQKEWDEVFDVNVRAPAVLTRAAARHLLPQGSGKIINVASTSGIKGKPTLVAYSSSKGAVVQFTKALAGEWAKKGVQVNAIAPGAFTTDAQSAVTDSPDVLARRLKKIPAGRMGDPAEFGPLVAYLSSPLSNFITGSVAVIDGGEVSRL